MMILITLNAVWDIKDGKIIIMYIKLNPYKVANRVIVPEIDMSITQKYTTQPNTV